MIVIGVIALLVGIGIPTYRILQAQAQRRVSQGLVETVAAAVSSYGQLHFTLYEDDNGDGVANRARYPAWDVDADGRLDGDIGADRFWRPPPALAASGGASQRAMIRYQGFVATANPALPRERIETSTRRVTDTWGRPLRIAYAIEVYGDRPFGIWSTGPDGLDQGGSGDDIPSW